MGNAGAATATPGVTSKTVTIGATVPLSGIASSYKSVSAAANAVFQWVNKKGGVNGRTIKYIRLDDCYGLAAEDASCTAGASTTTLSQNTVLVAQDHVFATVGSLGTAAEQSVLSYLKQNGVPQLFVASGSSLWNQPKTYPDLFGFQTSYESEGKIFAKYINATYPGATVGFIGQNDDFGTNGLLGLSEGGLTIPSALALTYNAADAITGSSSDIETDVGTLQAEKATVVVLDSVPGFTKGILEVAYALGYSPHWIISSVGSDPTSVGTPLEDGAVSLDYFPPANSTTDNWIPWVRKVLTADQTDFPGFNSSTVITGNELYGVSYGVAFVEALKAEGRTVTRAGFVKELQSLTLDTPAVVPLKYSATNHQGLMGGVLVTVAPNGTSAPTEVSAISHTVYTTNSGTGPITTASGYTSAPIPSWLK